MAEDLMRKCPDCLAEVPVKAKKCSHCGSKLPQPTSPIIKGILIVFGVGFFFSFIMAVSSGTPSSSQPKQPSTYDYQLSARSYSEVYVQRILKSPSTAKFCRGTATDIGDNRWQVKSCVDSQNSFGAMLRSDWEAIMVYTGGDPADIGSWKAEKVVFDGEVVYQE